MRTAHTVVQVRAAEAELTQRLPPGALMQRAVSGLAVACAGRLGRVYGARVVVLAGAGDNGADALWTGARLAARGARVTAVVLGEPRADALAGLLAAGGRLGDLDTADLVLDGLVGIGGRGPLRPQAAALARRAGAYDVVAVDLPSGVDADTGAVEGQAVRADLTVCLGTLKPGVLVGAGRRHAGQVVLVDIGLDLPDPVVQVLEPADVARLLPRPGAGADKYVRGVLGVAAGSQTYPGAAVLAVGAALQAGAGMVRFAGAPHPAGQVRARWPECVVSELEGAAVVQAGRVQAWVVGPGLGTDGRAAETVEAVLAQDVPVLVDADALTVCAQHPGWLRRRSAPTLLTPHDREYARLRPGPGATAGEDPVGADRIGAARRLAEDLGVTVLLKGDATVVVGGPGPARVNATGSPVLASAGTGDVLAGGAGALLAQGLSAVDAGSVAAHLHGRAGALSADGATTTALGVLASWSDAVREAARLEP